MEPSETAEKNTGGNSVVNQNSFFSTVDSSDILIEVDKFSLVPVSSDATYWAGQDLSVLNTNASERTAPSFGIPTALVETSATNVTETGSMTMEPFKRPGKLEAPVNFPPVAPLPDRPGRITNQLKFLQSAVCQSLWRCRVAWPFLSPVDPVGLNCPDYYEIIKNPMDLGTIKQRLLNQFYWSAQECIADFNLMFENCRTYNNPGDPVVRDCNELDKILREKITLMPSVEMVIGSGHKYGPVKKNVGAKKKDATRMSTAVVGFSSEPMSQVTTVPGNKCVKRKADTTTSACFNQEHPLGIGGPVRQRAGQIAQHRQGVPKDQGAGRGRRTRPRLTGELRQCKEILKELMSRRHQAIAYFFYEPVDPVKHEAPGYFDVIKNPMDLGTVQKNLDDGFYKTCAEFAADVRLIFTNCLTYNQQDYHLRQSAQKMQVLFENRFAAMIDESGESEAFEHEEVRKTKRKHSSSESEDNSEEERKNKILLLQTQIAAVNQQLADLHAEGAKKALEKFNQRRRKRKADAPSPPKHPNRGNARPMKDSSSRSSLSKQGVQRGLARTSETVEQPMDRQDLANLSEQMSQLPSPAHTEVFRIMQSMELVQGTSGAEFVVDFEKLQPRTVRALRAYVTDYFDRKAQAYASDHGMGVESAGEVKVERPQNSEESSESTSSSSSSSADSSSDSSEDEDKDGKGENEISENAGKLYEASSRGSRLNQPIHLDGTQQQQQLFLKNTRKPSVPVVETVNHSLPLPYDIQKQSFHRGNTDTLPLLQEQVQKPSMCLRDDQKQSCHGQVEIQHLSNRDNEPPKPYPSHVPEIPKNPPYVIEQQKKLIPMTQTHSMTPIMRQEQNQSFLARCPQKQFVPPYTWGSRNSYAPAQEFVSVIPKALQAPPIVGLPLDAIKAKQQYQKQQDDKRKHDQEMEKRRLQAEQDAQRRLAEERRKHNQQVADAKVAMSRSQMISRASEKLFTMKAPPTPLRNNPVANPAIVQVVAVDGSTSGKVDAERQKMREEEQRRRKQVASQIDLNYQSELLSKFESGELDGLI